MNYVVFVYRNTSTKTTVAYHITQIVMWKLTQVVSVVVLVVIILACVGYLVACIVLYARQHKMIFQPSRVRPQDMNPCSMYGLHYQSVQFRAADDVELHGWWISANSSNVTSRHDAPYSDHVNRPRRDSSAPAQRPMHSIADGGNDNRKTPELGEISESTTVTVPESSDRHCSRTGAVQWAHSDELQEAFWLAMMRRLDATDDRPVILFCHGNSGNMTHRVQAVEQFWRLNYHTFIFDYRGFGNSRGKPTEHGVVVDACAAYEYLIRNRQIDPRRIVVVGRSLGGAVAMALCDLLWRKTAFAPRLVLQCTFCSVRALMKTSMGTVAPLLFGWLLKTHFPTKQRLMAYPAPVMVLHALHDVVVPYSHGVALGRVVTKRHAQSKFVPLLSGGHNDCYSNCASDYMRTLALFIEETRLV